jgi:DNA-binding PadR family transcriptional regulator
MAPKPFERVAEKNTKENLWLYILRIIRDRPVHAYGLRAEIEKRFGFRPGNVTAYRVLYSLKRDGMVAKKTEGRRKIYTITGKGRKELAEAVEFYKNTARSLQ